MPKFFRHSILSRKKDFFFFQERSQSDVHEGYIKKAVLNCMIIIWMIKTASLPGRCMYTLKNFIPFHFKVVFKTKVSLVKLCNKLY